MFIPPFHFNSHIARLHDTRLNCKFEKKNKKKLCFKFKFMYTVQVLNNKTINQ